MKAERNSRPNRKSAAERAQERRLRDALQKKRPTLEDLIQSGNCDPDAVMTMGMHFDVQGILQSLMRDRKASGLTINEVAKRSGLDRAVVSRLENGKQDNPTVATLMRYAAAVGKRLVWTYENLSPGRSTRRNGDARQAAALDAGKRER